MTYEELRKQTCQWCAKGMRKASDSPNQHQPKWARWHFTEAEHDGLIGFEYFPCTAPSPIEAYDDLARRMEEVRRKIEAHLDFHAKLAAECERSGKDFASGRCVGIRDLSRDIREALALSRG